MIGILLLRKWQQSWSNRNRSAFLLLIIALIVLYGLLQSVKNLKEYKQKLRTNNNAQRPYHGWNSTQQTSDSCSATQFRESRPVPLRKTLGAFIHVGKTGGTSPCCPQFQIRLSLVCNRKMQKKLDERQHQCCEQSDDILSHSRLGNEQGRRTLCQTVFIQLLHLHHSRSFWASCFSFSLWASW